MYRLQLSPPEPRSQCSKFLRIILADICTGLLVLFFFLDAKYHVDVKIGSNWANISMYLDKDQRISGLFFRVFCVQITRALMFKPSHYHLWKLLSIFSGYLVLILAAIEYFYYGDPYIRVALRTGIVLFYGSLVYDSDHSEEAYLRALRYQKAYIE